MEFYRLFSTIEIQVNHLHMGMPQHRTPRGRVAQPQVTIKVERRRKNLRPLSCILWMPRRCTERGQCRSLPQLQGLSY